MWFYNGRCLQQRPMLFGSEIWFSSWSSATDGTDGMALLELTVNILKQLCDVCVAWAER